MPMLHGRSHGSLAVVFLSTTYLTLIVVNDSILLRPTITPQTRRASEGGPHAEIDEICRTSGRLDCNAGFRRDERHASHRRAQRYVERLRRLPGPGIRRRRPARR